MSGVSSDREHFSGFPRAARPLCACRAGRICGLRGQILPVRVRD
jgi:hypothetical protein